MMIIWNGIEIPIYININIINITELKSFRDHAFPCEFFSHCRTLLVSWLQRSSGAELWSTPKMQPACADDGGGWSRHAVQPFQDAHLRLVYLPVLMVMWSQKKTFEVWFIAPSCCCLPDFKTVDEPPSVDRCHQKWRMSICSMSADYNTLKLQYISLLVKNIFLLITLIMLPQRFITSWHSVCLHAIFHSTLFSGRFNISLCLRSWNQTVKVLTTVSTVSFSQKNTHWNHNKTVVV